MKTFGRKTIKIGFEEKELLDLEDDQLIEFCKKILPDISAIHEDNRSETVYLKDYYKGNQDILREKEKLTRPEINNKTVENWAYSMVEFAKAYLLGKPIQYVRNDDNGNEEISKLNKFVRYEHKKAKDQLLYGDMLISGRGFRYINYDPKSNEDEAPFEIINAEPQNTEVVYSNRLGNEQLFSFIVTPMSDSIENPDVLGEYLEIDYNEYTFYFRNRSFTINDMNLKIAEKLKKEVQEPYTLIGSVKPIMLKEHIIVEYYINEDRISLIEIGKDLFNDINYLESLDKDDMEQFVNAIMVFTNAEIDEEELDRVKELGAMSISSTENKQAKVELLQQRLKASDTQVYYTRLLTSLHQILGVPMANDMGTATSGDTGKSKLTGQGFTSAGIKAEVSQTMFEMCDLKALKIILKICKSRPNTGIQKLKASDIELIFERDKSENLLVKTQALLNLYSCDIPRSIANSIIGLFGDPNAVTMEQKRLFGEQESQQSQKESFFEDEKTTNDNDIANQQNNKITKTNQTSIQDN